MSEQKFPPRFIRTVSITGTKEFWDLKSDVTNYVDCRNPIEYLSLTEHQHLMAEKDKQIERLREALEYYSTADNIEVIKSQYFEQHDEGCREFGYVARLVLQEETK